MQIFGRVLIVLLEGLGIVNIPIGIVEIVKIFARLRTSHRALAVFS